MQQLVSARQLIGLESLNTEYYETSLARITSGNLSNAINYQLDTPMIYFSLHISYIYYLPTRNRRSCLDATVLLKACARCRERLAALFNQIRFDRSARAIRQSGIKLSNASVDRSIASTVNLVCYLTLDPCWRQSRDPCSKASSHLE